MLLFLSLEDLDGGFSLVSDQAYMEGFKLFSTFNFIYYSKGNECAAGVRNTYTEQHRQKPTPYTTQNTQ